MASIKELIQYKQSDLTVPVCNSRPNLLISADFGGALKVRGDVSGMLFVVKIRLI